MLSQQYFRVDKRNISYVGGDFQYYFSDMEVVIPKKATFISKKLPRNMTDKQILSELKPEPISLGDLAYILETLDKDTWGIFYIEDNTGVFCMVYVYWDGDGWIVSADSVENTYRWGGGNQVFSRNFDLKASDTLPPFIMVGNVKYIRE